MAELFRPLSLRDVTLRNRIAVAPMCQYSANDGVPTDWHLVHLGARAIGGAGLVIAEATGVVPEGRISPGCTGIWNDTQVEAFARITHFVKGQGAVAGLQIAHAGRKASAHRPWEGDSHLQPAEGGWTIYAPSAEAFGAHLPRVPQAMTIDQIRATTQAFVDAAKRALAAGFELLELHFAHGYLAHSFLSPLSNHRTDQYGGDFEGRSRFLIETFEAVRAVWPERLPLIVRMSVTDWIEGGLTVDESIELIRRLKDRGLDLIDVSQGFVIPDLSVIPWGPAFMAPIAERIRKEAQVATAVGWMINDPHQAESIVASGQADMVMLAREMLRDPHWPYHAAQALGIEAPQRLLPSPYSHWLA